MTDTKHLNLSGFYVKKDTIAAIPSLEHPKLLTKAYCLQFSKRNDFSLATLPFRTILCSMPITVSLAAAAAAAMCPFTTTTTSTASDDGPTTKSAVGTSLHQTSTTIPANPKSGGDVGVNPHHRVRVAIVGAGASGLQCGSALVQDYGWSAQEDVLLVEARNRTGGRIHTTIQSATNVHDPDHRTVTTFPMDQGAAWVHGTGLNWATPIHRNHHHSDVVDDDDDDNSDDVVNKNNTKSNNNKKKMNGNHQAKPMFNPMMHLLQQETVTAANLSNNNINNNNSTSNQNADVYERHLNFVFDGNPWLRPRTVLHQKNQLGLFVAGKQLDSAHDGTVIEQALQQHFALLRDVSRVGNDLFHEGRGLETASTSLAETVQSIRRLRQARERDRTTTTTRQEEEEQQQQSSRLTNKDEEFRLTVEALTPFFMHLIECWYGSATSALQLSEFINEDESQNKNGRTTAVVEGQEDAEYAEEGDFYGPHCTLRRGMESVLQPLLKDKNGGGVQNRILLQQEVTKISCIPDNHSSIDNNNNNSNTGGVWLETAAGLTIHADVCVVTIPAGCLKAAVRNKVFATALSDAKLEAISYTQMGSYKKVFLTFDRIFWPIQPAFLGMVRKLRPQTTTAFGTKPKQTDKLGNYLLLDNLWAAGGLPSVEAVLFGAAGTWSIYKSEMEIRNAVLEFVAEAMGLREVDLQSYCQSCHVTRWEEDPYSLGAYSSMALGALERHVEELRRPEWDRRLIFAGEATISELEGSVHAALFSGRNAAETVNAYLLTTTTTTHPQEERPRSTPSNSVPEEEEEEEATNSVHPIALIV